MSTQPVEASIDDRRRLVDYLRTVEGIEEMLCFSSDYPHWDADEPTFIGSILPPEWHGQVFYANARRLLRLPRRCRCARLRRRWPAEPPIVIDACIHHRWVADVDVHPYIDEGWREYVGEPRSVAGRFGARRLVPLTRYANPMGNDLETARPNDGSPPGSSLGLLEEQVLDPGGARRALLVFDRAKFAPSHPNPFFAEAIVRAINDWNIDQWLSRDDRLTARR